MKKQMLAETAANLYIEKFMTLETIAKQLNVIITMVTSL